MRKPPPPLAHPTNTTKYLTGSKAYHHIRVVLLHFREGGPELPLVGKMVLALDLQLRHRVLQLLQFCEQTVFFFRERRTFGLNKNKGKGEQNTE